MSDPVFVIHGVNVRDAAAFAAVVLDLNRRVGSAWRFIPVYWGDLGGSCQGVEATIPRGATRMEAASLLNVDADPVRIDAADVAGAAAERVHPSLLGGSIYIDVQRQWQQTEWLRLIEDAALAEDIGGAIGETVAAAESTPGYVMRAADERVTASVVRAFDHVVGAIASRVLGGLNRTLRTNFGPTLARFLGDVFVYENDRERIQHRLTDAMSREGVGTEMQPATVLAHSLGGVVTFSAAVRARDPVYLDRLVTFGSQSAFFHIIRAIAEVPTFDGSPVEVPPRIGRWFNIWEPLDPLAFLAANVFRLANGEVPIDRELPHTRAHTLWTHASYWADPAFATLVRDFLSQPGR